MDIKRMWDTTQKKVLWSTNTSGKVGQVWKRWEGLYVDNKGQREEMGETQSIYWPVWKELPDGDSIGYYDTNEPTNVQKPSELLTYDELVALNDHSEVMAVLSGAPTAYYLSLSEAWHIQVQGNPEEEGGSIWLLVDSNENETVIDFHAYAYIISSPDEEQMPSKTWMEQNRPN